MQELQEQRGSGERGSTKQQQAEKAQQYAEQQKQAPLKQHLTDEARQCFNAIQISKPDFAKQVERQVVTFAQNGCIQDRVDDDKMKALLKELQPESKSLNIRRR